MKESEQGPWDMRIRKIENGEGFSLMSQTLTTQIGSSFLLYWGEEKEARKWMESLWGEDPEHSFLPTESRTDGEH